MNCKPAIVFLASLFCLVIYHAITMVSGLKLGSIDKPVPEHTYIMLQWMLIGTLSTFFMAQAIVKADKPLKCASHILLHTPLKKFVALTAIFVLFAAARKSVTHPLEVPVKHKIPFHSRFSTAP